MSHIQVESLILGTTSITSKVNRAIPLVVNTFRCLHPSGGWLICSWLDNQCRVTIRKDKASVYGCMECVFMATIGSRINEEAGKLHQQPTRYSWRLRLEFARQIFDLEPGWLSMRFDTGRTNKHDADITSRVYIPRFRTVIRSECREQISVPANFLVRNGPGRRLRRRLTTAPVKLPSLMDRAFPATHLSVWIDADTDRLLFRQRHSASYFLIHWKFFFAAKF